MKNNLKNSHALIIANELLNLFLRSYKSVLQYYFFLVLTTSLLKNNVQDSLNLWKLECFSVNANTTKFIYLV